MDDQEKLEPNDEDSLKSQDVNEASKEYIKRIKEEIPRPQDGAGPSSELPGTVLSEPRTNLQRQLSKSEHNIRHITTQDLENALKSFKISPIYEPTHYKNILKNLDIPMIHTIAQKKELRPKITEANNLPLSVCNNEVQQNCTVLTSAAQPVQSSLHTNIVQMVSSPNPIVSSNVQTDAVAVIDLKNDVLNSDPKPIDNKLSKESKKKTSGSLSEKSDLPLGQRDSLSSIGSNVCRICMTKGRERLISPCNCKGSLANVHLSCLERWLNQVGRNHCELCGFSYPAIRTPRYTVLQALRLWFGNPRNRSHLQSDCLIFWLLSTVTAGLLAVCIVGTQYFVIEGSKFGKHEGPRKDEGISHRITETAMDFFMAIVLCGYSVTVYLLWKDHYVMWNRWRRANVNVRLLLTPDSNPVPFVPRPAYRIV